MLFLGIISWKDVSCFSGEGSFSDGGGRGASFLSGGGGISFGGGGEIQKRL